MLDTPSNTVSDVRLQSFSIAYEYPQPHQPLPDRRSRAQRGRQASPMRCVRRRGGDVGDAGTRGSDFSLRLIPCEPFPNSRLPRCCARRRELQERSRYYSTPARKIFRACDRPAFLCDRDRRRCGAGCGRICRGNIPPRRAPHPFSHHGPGTG